MASQIIIVDTTDVPRPVPIRPDVSALFIVATDAGRPLDVQWIPRPSGDLFDAGALVATLRSNRADTSEPSKSATAPMSVVVCTRERPEDLGRCLEAIARCVRAGDETIVVDNNPQTDATAMAAARFGVRYIVEAERGLNRARNAGLEAARHEVVAFVDDDVVVTPSWREGIVRGFAEPGAACVTGLVLPMELETGAQEEFEAYAGHRRTFATRVFSADTLRPSAADVAGVGANMAFLRQSLVRLGGFDARLDAGTCTRAGGDTEMLARVLDSGARIVYVPDAQVWHRHRRTMAEVTACAFGYGAGTFAMLTKRVFVLRDAGALVTAARWIAGTALKALRDKVVRRRSPSWRVIVAEWMGAACGPFVFAYETWRNRHQPSGLGAERRAAAVAVPIGSGIQERR